MMKYDAQNGIRRHEIIKKIYNIQHGIKLQVNGVLKTSPD